jgi:transcription elongation GreA/GreB family factor
MTDDLTLARTARRDVVERLDRLEARLRSMEELLNALNVINDSQTKVNGAQDTVNQTTLARLDVIEQMVRLWLTRSARPS